MAAAASKDIRRRVVESYLAGEGSYEEIAARFRVGRASVSRWLRLYRETNNFNPRPRGGGAPPRIDQAGFELLRELVAEQPDVTLAELTTKYAERRGAQVGVAIMCRALKKLGLRRKKK